MFKKVKKRAITLVEMMIVMFLIAMITGVIAYNYSGSLEEGKAFKTKAGMEKIRSILALYQAEHPNEEIGNWKDIVSNSNLTRDGAALTKDGWGQDYNVDFKDGEIDIKSARLEQYESNKRNKKK